MGSLGGSLGSEFRLALDPVALAVKAGMDPLPWQVSAMRSQANRQLYLASRQSGKSTLAATIAMHTVLFRPESLVVMVSRTQDHSGELFRRALQVYRATGRLVDSVSETALSLTLANGSRIISRPGSSDTAVRGFSASLLVIDEAARVSDELYAAALPTLAKTGGRIIALSTPYGQAGFFFDAWTKGEGWDKFYMPASQLPSDWYKPSTATFLAQQRRERPEHEYNREFECLFEERGATLFPRELVERAVTYDEDALVFENLEGWE